jgi:hypothetical protein
MTKGWKLCVKWKDSTTSWEQLADLKESYPSYRGSWVCRLSRHPWRSCFRMVGTICTCEAQSNYICGE